MSGESKPLWTYRRRRDRASLEPRLEAVFGGVVTKMASPTGIAPLCGAACCAAPLDAISYDSHMAKPPLIFTFYIAAPIDKVWNGFVSKETNQTIFMGADLEADLRPGGAMTWSGPGKDGQRTRYVTGEVLAVEAPTRLVQVRNGRWRRNVPSEDPLTQETEAVKVVVTNDDWRTTILRTNKMRMAGRESSTLEDAARDGKNLSAALIAPKCAKPGAP